MSEDEKKPLAAEPRLAAEPTRFDYTPRNVRRVGRGYSRFVAVLKFTLPIGALVIIGVLIMRLSGTTAVIPQPELTSLPETEKTTPGQIELIQPKYEGTDDQGRPYTVTADKATRAVETPDKVLFENPAADITLADKSWIAVKGKTGSLDHKTDILRLNDDVTIFHDGGYEMHLRDIELNLKDKSAQTAQPVKAQGPVGTIAAQGMTVKDTGNKVIFAGPAVVTFFKGTKGGG